MTRTFHRAPKLAASSYAAKWRGLAVSQPSDHYEREADRIEDASRTNGFGPQDRPLRATHPGQSAPGNPVSAGALPPKLQAEFAARLAHNFADVRVHHDAEADVSARRKINPP